MKQKLSELKKELINLLILFLIILALFKIIFFKETFVITLKTVFAIFWLLAIPGYFLMLYWKNQLGFTERIVIGTALSAAIIGIFSYYIGLVGLNIRYHGILLPIFLSLIGFYFYFKKKLD